MMSPLTPATVFSYLRHAWEQFPSPFRTPTTKSLARFYTPEEIDAIELEDDMKDDLTFVDVSGVKDTADLDMDHVRRMYDAYHASDAFVLVHTLLYVRQFLASPHPNLNRAAGGPVCPFVPRTLKQQRLWTMVARNTASDSAGQRLPWTTESIGAQLRSVLQWWNAKMEELPNESSRLYSAVIVVFPDVKLSEAHELIDGSQYDLKPDFVKNGLMLGEFHLLNNGTGLHSDSFFPLRLPWPALAIRRMVPQDLPFLDREHYARDRRMLLLSAYLDLFPKATALRAQAAASLERLRSAEESK